MTQEPRSKNSDSVRAVERAIDLLEALNRNPLSTLGELHRRTGIPKSSLVRLLRALESEGLVAQSSSYSAYRLLGRVTSLSSGFPKQPLIVDLAEDAMIDFTKREGWPLALALFDEDAMVVRASTIPYTSFALVQSSLEIRLSLVGYALGQAYLAYLSPGEQKRLLDIARRSADPEDAASRDFRGIKQLLAQVRERGYALRNRLFHSQSSTIAVPVYENGRVAASLGLTWLSAAMPLQKALEHYLPQILGMSEAITRELDVRSHQERRLAS
jgi:IclR family mhp operon transcriptional activator